MTDLLVTFLSMAECSLGLHQDDLFPTPLGAAIEQQLQQAGFYQHMQHFLVRTTEQMAAAEGSPELMVACQHSPNTQPGGPQHIFASVVSDTMQALALYALMVSLLPKQQQGTTAAAWDASIDAAAMSLAQTTYRSSACGLILYQPAA